MSLLVTRGTHRLYAPQIRYRSEVIAENMEFPTTVLLKLVADEGVSTPHGIAAGQ